MERPPVVVFPSALAARSLPRLAAGLARAMAAAGQAHRGVRRDGGVLVVDAEDPVLAASAVRVLPGVAEAAIARRSTGGAAGLAGAAAAVAARLLLDGETFHVRSSGAPGPAAAGDLEAAATSGIIGARPGARPAAAGRADKEVRVHLSGDGGYACIFTDPGPGGVPPGSHPGAMACCIFDPLSAAACLEAARQGFSPSLSACYTGPAGLRRRAREVAALLPRLSLAEADVEFFRVRPAGRAASLAVAAALAVRAARRRGDPRVCVPASPAADPASHVDGLLRRAHAAGLVPHVPLAGLEEAALARAAAAGLGDAGAGLALPGRAPPPPPAAAAERAAAEAERGARSARARAGPGCAHGLLDALGGASRVGGIGYFVNPWGGGHWRRALMLHAELAPLAPGEAHHFVTGPPLLERARREAPGRVHAASVPVPIDGGRGPDVARSLLNVLLPAAGRPPLVAQIARCLREQRAVVDGERLGLLACDGDPGPCVLGRNRGLPSLFVTNQFSPRLARRRAYLRPGAAFISRQIAKATVIAVADSPPPYAICERNLNLSGAAAEKAVYTGHFAEPAPPRRRPSTDLERLAGGADYGYWARTGSGAVNDWTGAQYEGAFRELGAGERRVVTHARPGAESSALLRDGRRVPLGEAAGRGADWVQIDVGWASEAERAFLLGGCAYAVVNGSHTVMGEVLGAARRPAVCMPLYDEHDNHARWAEERGLGLRARGAREAAAAVRALRADPGRFEEGLARFARGFRGGGARAAARLAAGMLAKG